MPHPLLNKTAPSLTLPNASGEQFTLEPGKSGVPTALFFYPAAGTYGCTKEACEFRDAVKVFKRTKCEVVGVSQDAVAKQKKFVDEQGLNYPVLSDASGEARKAYSVGKGLMGLTEARVTFFIDSKGIVRDVYDSTLNFSAHSKFVSKWLEKVEKETPSM
ncbi:peroxiredoxin Q [Sistotremastrum niveocremeum HHB9708]|uniref:thioredoxin-dependent peroxiredoxin n=2 Tax=Sistotremastraceae TaxID=3402574 RepID=A0A164UJN2_9AGAM|nr:peroxiredoxin Q [Sistotremastrum niveocremeum HHB9708]KZT43907.1 AhpC-TSA-domain-containing protein [Sistotremastrum suecicum HHB10207 ss-3]